MKEAISSTPTHCCKTTDKSPTTKNVLKEKTHGVFPERTIAKKRVPESHLVKMKPPLSEPTVAKLIPLYTRLSTDELLTRCLPGRTLNANQGIQCDGPCNRWFHKECAKVTKPEYERISSNSNLAWYCYRSDCTTFANSSPNADSIVAQLKFLNDKFTEISDKLEKLTFLPEKIDDINQKLTSIENRIGSSEARIDSLEHRMNECSDYNPELLIAEMNERARRSCNMMIFNLPESNSPDTGVKKNS